MKRRVFVALSGLWLAGTAPAVAQADALAPGTHGGQIVSIDTAASVIVLRLGRSERRARFGPLTRVRIGGALAAVTDLRPGMSVVVQFAASETGRETAMLVSVDVRRDPSLDL